jgi:hypothetical protein
MRFYKVAAIRSAANATSVITVGKHLIILEPYWNMISWPLLLSNLTLKNTTTDGYELPVDPPDCVSQIWRYNNSLEDPWEFTTREANAWLPATGDENFTVLEPNRAYWLYNNLTQTCNLTFAGAVPATTANISLNSEFNLMAGHSEDRPTVPTDCAEPYPFEVTPANSITTLYYYNSTTDTFKGTAHYTWSGCGGDNSWGWWPDSRSSEFTNLNPSKGYYVKTSQIGNWTVEPLR